MAQPPGLCGNCAHARVVENRRGSRFYLCRLAEVNPAFPRYPRLPVLRCAGYRRAEASDAAEPGAPVGSEVSRRTDDHSIHQAEDA